MSLGGRWRRRCGGRRVYGRRYDRSRHRRAIKRRRGLRHAQEIGSRRTHGGRRQPAAPRVEDREEQQTGQHRPPQASRPRTSGGGSYRKSDVEGKGVSVRVDAGCPRNKKKKTKEKT